MTATGTDIGADAYDQVVNDFHDKQAARIGNCLEQLRALEDELEEIQVDLETGP